MPENNINAVLVRLSISILPNGRQDIEITNEVKKRHKMQGKAGKWTKYKLPDESLEPIRKYAGEFRRRHYDVTLPWEDGYRLLTLASKPAYDESFVKFKAGFDELVQEFIDAYPEWLQKAKAMHGDTFNALEYPSQETLTNHFKFLIEYTPVPLKNHFIGQLSAQALEEMQTSLEQRNAQRVEAAVADTFTRLIGPVQSMAEKLEKDDKIFRDTLVTNIKDIVELVPSLNLTNNPELVLAAEAIKSNLANIDPEKLREDKVLRRETAEQAKKIVAQFGQVGKRKLAA